MSTSSCKPPNFLSVTSFDQRYCFSHWSVISKPPLYGNLRIMPLKKWATIILFKQALTYHISPMKMHWTNQFNAVTFLPIPASLEPAFWIIVDPWCHQQRFTSVMTIPLPNWCRQWTPPDNSFSLCLSSSFLDV